jgi:DNA-binding LacI/PurR family transcriptional regulator
MAQSPKHKDISRELRAEIAMEKFGPAGRLPSEAQLVRRFRVSRPTVIRALRDLQAEELIERRAGSGTYVRNRTARTAASNQLGLLVPSRQTTEIFDLICGELAGLARAQNYGLLWGNTTLPQGEADLSAKDALHMCEQFIEQRVMGVFFAPFDLTEDQSKVNNAIAARFRRAGMPVVLLDRDLTAFPERSAFDLIGIDNFAAAAQLTEHLIKLGSERVAFVTRPYSAPTVDARIAGVREILRRHRIEPSRDWLQIGDPEDVKVVRRLTAAHRWDAFVCANDLTAAQLMRTLEKLQVRVPADVRVVGFDDAKYATLLGVSLTTMHQPTADIARMAFRVLLERIAEPTLPERTVFLSARLVVRESCGAYATKQKSGSKSAAAAK